MKLIDNLGLKNFRIFDDKEGFFEEISAINILTGANSSGKSTIIKSLQMLKNSVKEGNPVFDLDLTQQEHLLGDFDDILFNKNNKTVEVSLPFTFLGLTNLYASLSFAVQDAPNNYKAKLRGIEILDNVDKTTLFSFRYKDATTEKKEEYLKNFEAEKRANEEALNSTPEDGETIFSPRNSWFSLPYDPLEGYIEYHINYVKLKKELDKVVAFYEMYLKNYNGYGWIDRMDDIAETENMPFVPSILINSFKNNVKIDEWKDFSSRLPLEASISRREICESDFDTDDYYPAPKTEEVLYYRSLDILKKNMTWMSVDKDKETYNVIENCFKSAWNGLINRISTVNYLSAVKEQNSRIYNSSSDSHFINLLKDFSNYIPKYSAFLNEYLQKFEIGTRVEIDYQLKYQLISITITTTNGIKRDLVDFGYGIKQLILILIQIAVLGEKNKRTREEFDNQDGPFYKTYHLPSLLIVEEPEANLHPKWQSLLAELFVRANEKYNIQFLIETHSEYLIRKFQTLVAEKQFDGRKIKIFYLRNYEKISSNKKHMSSFHIQPDGSIDYKLFDSGFFDESENLELSLLNIQRDSFIKDFNDLKNQNIADSTKITNLENKIDEYVYKLDIGTSEQIIVQHFHTAKLLDLTVRYLASGQYLLNNINDNDDFSPAILQFGRAVENELKNIFLSINPEEKWMMGVMQGSMEKFKTGRYNVNPCSNAHYEQLRIELENRFNSPLNLKIELLQALREKRNSVAHAGESKTKDDALAYVQLAKEFLDSWTSEKN